MSKKGLDAQLAEILAKKKSPLSGLAKELAHQEKRKEEQRIHEEHHKRRLERAQQPREESLENLAQKGKLQALRSQIMGRDRKSNEKSVLEQQKVDTGWDEALGEAQKNLRRDAEEDLTAHMRKRSNKIKNELEAATKKPEKKEPEEYEIRDEDIIENVSAAGEINLPNVELPKAKDIGQLEENFNKGLDNLGKTLVEKGDDPNAFNELYGRYSAQDLSDLSIAHGLEGSAKRNMALAEDLRHNLGAYPELLTKEMEKVLDSPEPDRGKKDSFVEQIVTQYDISNRIINDVQDVLDSNGSNFNNLLNEQLAKRDKRGYMITKDYSGLLKTGGLFGAIGRKIRGFFIKRKLDEQGVEKYKELQAINKNGIKYLDHSLKSSKKRFSGVESHLAQTGHRSWVRTRLSARASAQGATSESAKKRI